MLIDIISKFLDDSQVEQDEEKFDENIKTFLNRKDKNIEEK